MGPVFEFNSVTYLMIKSNTVNLTQSLLFSLSFTILLLLTSFQSHCFFYNSIYYGSWTHWRTSSSPGLLPVSSARDILPLESFAQMSPYQGEFSWLLYIIYKVVFIYNPYISLFLLPCLTFSVELT